MGPGGRVSPAKKYEIQGGNVRRTKGAHGTTDADNTRPYGLSKGPRRGEGAAEEGRGHRPFRGERGATEGSGVCRGGARRTPPTTTAPRKEAAVPQAPFVNEPRRHYEGRGGSVTRPTPFVEDVRGRDAKASGGCPPRRVNPNNHHPKRKPPLS